MKRIRRTATKQGYDRDFDGPADNDLNIVTLGRSSSSPKVGYYADNISLPGTPPPFIKPIIRESNEFPFNSAPDHLFHIGDGHSVGTAATVESDPPMHDPKVAFEDAFPPSSDDEDEFREEDLNDSPKKLRRY
jgi:hypothetical protein